jgi:RNA polymerase sigma-70 factor (ECF subfamily)
VNEAAFRAFYEQTAPALRSYLRFSCRDATLADDLLQDAYLRMLRADLPPLNEAASRSYLYKTARSAMLDHFRRTRRERQSPDEGWFDELPGTPAPDLPLDLAPILEQLRPRDRQLLWLAYVEGFSHREIAEVTGIQEKSVRVLLLRARERMIQVMQDQGIGPREAL